MDVNREDEAPDDDEPESTADVEGATGTGDEESPPKPPKGPERGTPPPKGKAKRTPAEGRIEVDARRYTKTLEELDQLRSEREQQQRERRERERQKTEEIASKDWPKAKERLERQHAAQLQEASDKLARYERRLQTFAVENAIRSGLSEWERANPTKPINRKLVPHLLESLRGRFDTEWDDEADDGRGDFVAIDRRTGLPASQQVIKLLATDDYDGFLTTTARPGPSATVGGVRPAADTGMANGAGTGGRSVNRFAEMYNRQRELYSKGDPASGVIPSVGLMIPPGTRAISGPGSS